MRKLTIALALAAGLAACGGDARPGAGGEGGSAQVDSGPAPTPALDSVGTDGREQGRVD